MRPMFQVLTIAREYGSGGGAIARRVAHHLGWRLLDGKLVEAVARTAQVNPEIVRRYDESTDSWWHKINRAGTWAAAVWAGVYPDDARCFDAAAVSSFTQDEIARAAARGACVIVGRGSQCVLRRAPEAFHVFILAPWDQRVERVRQRVPAEEDVEELIRSIDRSRAGHIRQYCGCDWKDPHLYHMMVSSERGEEHIARLIIAAMGVQSEIGEPAWAETLSLAGTR